MSSENHSSHGESKPHEVLISRTLRFWSMLIVYIPSVICSFFTLYHFIFNRQLRHALYNHVIILLLFINLVNQLTDIPWILNYYRLGYVSPATPSFCLVWTFMDETSFVTTTVLFSWATIERHILIFHDRLMRIKYKRILFHYLPMVIILVYCLGFNTILVFFPPCENTFDYSDMICGDPLCLYGTYVMGVFDVIVHNLIPIIIIIVCSVALLVRVVRQKNRMRQRIRWGSHRKMTIQVSSISLLYLVIYIPKMLMEFIYRCGVSKEVGADFTKYAEFFMDFGTLLLPFVCTGSLPDVQKKVKKIFSFRRREMRTVAPQTMTFSRRPELQTMAFSRRPEGQTVKIQAFG